MLHKNRIHFYLIGAICLLIVFYVIQFGAQRFNSEPELQKRFQKNLLEQQALLTSKSSVIISIINDSLVPIWPSLERLLNPDQINTQVFRNDSLIFWNSNHINNSLNYIQEAVLDTVIKEKTGWYLIHYEKQEDLEVYLFEQIKSEYSFENKFLPSETNPNFLSVDNIYLSGDISNARYIIENQNGKPIIGLNFDDLNITNQKIIFWQFLIFLLAYILIIFWMNGLYKRFAFLTPNKRLLFLIYIIDLALLRLLDYYFKYPAILKQSFIFEPRFEILPGMNSIGDLILTCVLLISIFYKFNQSVMEQKIIASKKHKYLQHMVSMLSTWLVTIGSFYAIYQIIDTVKINPVLGIQLAGAESLLSLFAIVLINIILFLMFRSMNYYSLRQTVPLAYKVLFLSILAAVTIIYTSQILIVTLVSLSLVILLMIVFTFLKDTANLRFLKYLVYLIIFAAANAVIINLAEHEAKDINQVNTANYLAQKSDQSLENVYTNFANDVKEDTVINLIIKNYKEDPEPAVNEYLKTNYFKELSGKYDIQATICMEDEVLDIQPEGILIGCGEYFNSLINDYGDSTQIENLYLQNSTPESIYYIGLIPEDILKKNELGINLYIEFYFAYVPEGLGYPELLVDNKTLAYDLSGYTFAKYRNDQLVYKFGDFPYYTDYESIRRFPAGEFYNYSGYRHLKLITTEGDTLIISRPLVRISEQLATFSMLFLIFGLMALAIFIAFFSKRAITYFEMSFRTRLQVFFISTISATILIIAIITTYYAEINSKDQLVSQLNEKTYSVLIELQHKLGTISSFDEIQVDELYPLLRKFSLVFFSDINVYDPSGKLMASSRPEIFRKGLLSDLINPLAFEEINVDNKLFYTAEEKIGKLSYYSSYVPLNLGENEPIGIVNLPYFARQTEVKKSYYLMIFSFLNLFVIAGILGTFIALFISKFLTRPLVVLQQNLADIRIDEQNERIDWVADDEIGLLIREYNQMVDKLEQSAELLKHSERESAWREVARQIAHEIKNPLTPMKLNVQYLEKAYNENDPGLKDKIKTISKSIIQQIDTLDQVAEMFSDFAKSNIRKMDKVELLAIIKSTIALYKNYDHVQFSINHEEDTYDTKAIEKDLIRVFNNLIKNSVQSLEKKEGGEINISISRTASFIEVQITDNGKGISDDFKAKVFQPYFTTKSGGTGLGLAIVKNIMNETGGNISFESSEEGTTFFLKFNSCD